MSPYIFQLFGVGILWVSFHCVGMCGPIVASLNTAVTDEGGRLERIRKGAANILAYQAGRAVTYAILGAAAGWLGASIEGAVHGVARVAALVAAGGMIGAGIWQLPPVQRAVDGRSAGSIGSTGLGLGRAARKLSRLLPSTGRLRLAAFGAVMGFLPCMLMFWVLGLAASTASVLQGVAVMLGLIALTTPVLIVAGTSPLVAGGFWRRHAEWVTAGAILVSGAWLGLIGAAANGWIDHLHFMFEWGGESYKMMIW